MRERPKYSTGFRVMLGGSAAAVLGVLLVNLGAKAVGGVLLVAGLLVAVWFKYPSDWSKTWPDDFPITAGLFGIEADHGRWAKTPTFWETAPARPRRNRAIFGLVFGAVLFAIGATDPTDYHGYPSRTGMFILGPILILGSILQLRRAKNDIRNE